MQTFITATVTDQVDELRVAQNTFQMLDRARLGKQRVEVKQLILGQYPNHPASKMWDGYEHALTAYGIICCKMWIRRGGEDSLLPYFQALRRSYIKPLVWPWWYGHPAMVRSHQSKLYYKNSPRWVAQYSEETIGKSMAGRPPMKLPYLWPSPTMEIFKISVAEQKRDGDWEIPSAWGYDHKTRIVVPR